MADLAAFRSLEPHEQAIVGLAVLLDGHDAASYLQSDKERSSALVRAANDLVQMAPDLRLPLAGTLLRRAIRELEGRLL